MTTMDPAAEVASLLTRLAELITTPISEKEPATRALPERVLLTVEEAAERLGIGRTTAYRLVRTGDLESVRIGTLRRISADAVNQYARGLVAEQSRKPAA